MAGIRISTKGISTRRTPGAQRGLRVDALVRRPTADGSIPRLTLPALTSPISRLWRNLPANSQRPPLFDMVVSLSQGLRQFWGQVSTTIERVAEAVSQMGWASAGMLVTSSGEGQTTPQVWHMAGDQSRRPTGRTSKRFDAQAAAKRALSDWEGVMTVVHGISDLAAISHRDQAIETLMEAGRKGPAILGDLAVHHPATIDQLGIPDHPVQLAFLRYLVEAQRHPISSPEVTERLLRAFVEICLHLAAVPLPPTLLPPTLHPREPEESLQMSEAEFQVYTHNLRQAWRGLLAVMTQIKTEGGEVAAHLDRLTTPFKGTIYETQIFDLQRWDLTWKEDQAPNAAARLTAEAFEAVRTDDVSPEVLNLIELLLLSAYRIVKYEERLREPHVTRIEHRAVTFDGLGGETLQIDILLVVLESMGGREAVTDLLQLRGFHPPSAAALDIIQSEVRDLYREGRIWERNFKEFRKAREAQRHLQDAEQLKKSGKWMNAADHLYEAAYILEELGLNFVAQSLRDQVQRMGGGYVEPSIADPWTGWPVDLRSTSLPPSSIPPIQIRSVDRN